MSERRETSRNREPERESRDRGGRTRESGRDESTSRRGSRDDDRGGRSSGRRFEYQGRDADTVNKRSTQGANEFDKFILDSVKLFKVNDGDNAIRILPPTWEKPKHYGYDIWVHYGVGPDRQTYLCAHKMKGEPCPICEERQRVLDDGDEKGAKELEPKRRVLVYMIDREAKNEGLQAWAMPWTVDRDICSISVDKRSGEVLPIDHPDEGYDIFFKKSGQKDRTEYTGVQADRHSSSLGNDRWLDAAVETPLPDTLVFFDYDHIAKVFGGGGSLKGRDDERGSHSSHGGSSRGGRGGSDDRDDPPRRGSDREDRGSSRRRDPEHTWADIHAMTSKELDDLADKLNVSTKGFDSDEELADELCAELKLEQEREPEPEPESRRRGGSDREDPRDRLREMRERRSRD